jgi:hypothetical protein
MLLAGVRFVHEYIDDTNWIYDINSMMYYK